MALRQIGEIAMKRQLWRGCDNYVSPRRTSDSGRGCPGNSRRTPIRGGGIRDLPGRHDSRAARVCIDDTEQSARTIHRG
jgi:hypothetical protein